MLFNSLHYLLFAPVVIGIYFLLPGRWSRWWLLAASLYFYAVFKITFILVLLISVLITYYGSIQTEKYRGQRAASWWLFSVIAGNVSILFFFKYLDFAVRSLNNLWFLSAPEAETGILPLPGIILPMGISFFTLQAIAYAVDVKRGVIPPASSLRDFTLFLSFFPQLVAGPIMRAKDLIWQFREKTVFTEENLRIGLLLIAMGIFKKTVIADQAGVLVDAVFAEPDRYNWVSLWMSVFAHAVQVYGDFSGYSDIAIGSARIMGFSIPQNFTRPLLASSITDIWRRWHISLSTWLRDYIYIPLGGSRVSMPRAYFNLLVVWFFAGVWHGADWTFILWGMVNAAGLISEKFLFGFPVIKKYYEKMPYLLRNFYTLTVFSFAIFFFRAHPTGSFTEGTQTAFFMVSRALSFTGGEWAVPGTAFIGSLTLLILFEFTEEYYSGIIAYFKENRLLQYSLAASVILFGFIVYSVTVSPQFIYFQF